VASGATAPCYALEGAQRFRRKVVLMSLSNIPIEIPILWPRMVMVSPRPRVLLTPPLPSRPVMVQVSILLLSHMPSWSGKGILLTPVLTTILATGWLFPEYSNSAF
jgi:hypothetical protein